MPIATGHEREELEAALEVILLVFLCVLSIFRFDVEKKKKSNGLHQLRFHGEINVELLRIYS